MSDTPPPPPDATPPPPPPSAAPAPGWWLASDGRWYPPQTTDAHPPAGPVPATNGQATAAMWLGIAAILLCWTVVGGWVLGILAIVFGAISKGKEPRTTQSTAGIAMGIVALVLPIVAIVALQSLGEEADTEFRCTGAAIDAANGNGTIPDDC